MTVIAALLWQTQLSQPSVSTSASPLDNPVTMAAFLSLLLGALIHFLPRIASALVKVIEAVAGIVEEWLRGMKARNDIIVELKDQIAAAFDRENAARDRENVAHERNIMLVNTANESNRLTNEANQQVVALTTEKLADADRIRKLEALLAEEEKKRKQAELRASMLAVYNRKDEKSSELGVESETTDPKPSVL